MSFKKIIKYILNEGHHGGHHGNHHGDRYKHNYDGHHDYRELQAYPFTQNTLVCKSCNFHNKAENKFCSECGQPLSMVKTCSACRASISINSKFCPECGKML